MAAPDFRSCAKTGINALQKWYRPATGQWQGTGWWNSANALTAVIRYTKLTGDESHASVIATTFTAAARTHAGFANTYYDDNAWWALAWVAAYDLTRNRRYLTTATSIFARNTAAWDGTCGGGLRWHAGTQYKNAITNELFITLAALLHQRVPGDQSYLSWAQRSWDWFEASGLVNPDHLVNDGLTATCQNNGQTTWTYNQGVILGGLAALYQITGDRAFLTQGEAIAQAALGKLTAAGVLAEPCEAAGLPCNEDQAQFKGIFVRYLYDFWLQDRQFLPPDHQPDYRAFIVANATSIWKHRNASGQFGLRWAAPCDHPTPARQSSALDALVTAAALSALPAAVTSGGLGVPGVPSRVPCGPRPRGRAPRKTVLTRVVSHHYLRDMTETMPRETAERQARRRMPAAERRELVLEAAVAEFAVHGLAGTSTEDVARRAGISQPYLFRLFPTKKALFLALVERCFRRVQDTFTEAAGDLAGDAALEAMAHAYEILLEDRTLLLMQMQAYAACDDPEIRAATRAGYKKLWEMVERITGLPFQRVVDFFAVGMLMNVAAAMDLPSVDERWTSWCPKD